MATPSPFNRPYAELAYGTGSLANHPAMPVGQGPMPASRRFAMASRQAVRAGDTLAAAELASRSQWAERMPVYGSRAPLPFLPPQQQMQQQQAAPMLPAGASMPVVPGAAVPLMPQAVANPQAGTQTADAGNPAPGADMPLDVLAPSSAMGAMPLSPLSGAGTWNLSDIPAPPKPYDIMPLPGTNNAGVVVNGRPTGSVVSLNKPLQYQPVAQVPGLMVPVGQGADRVPLMQQTINPGWSVTGQPKTKMEPVGQKTQALPEGIQYEKDDSGRIIGGVYPTYNDQGKLVMRRIDLDGDGVVSPQEQAAAMQAAGMTPGGMKFSRVQ